MTLRKTDDQDRHLETGMFWRAKKNGEGGSYYLSFRVNGGSKLKKIGRTYTEAKAARLKILYELKEGTFRSRRDITFAVLADKYLEYKAPSLKVSSLESMEQHLRERIVPVLGRRKLRNISPEHIDLLRTELIKDRKIGAETVNKHLTTVKAVLKQAVRWEFLNRNPAEFVERLKTESPEIKLLSSEEVERLLAVAEGQPRLIILTGVLSGLRAGEICGLRWKDVDLVDGIISVRQTYIRGQFETPKTRSSIRQVILPPPLVDALAKHKDAVTNDSELVFANRVGKPLNWMNFLHRDWSRLLKAAEASKVKFHSLRHNYVSILLAAGEDLTFIQRQVGHANLTVTLNTYSHLLPDKEIGAGNRIGEAFANYVGD